MPIFESALAAWQVVRVPFPFTDRQAVKNRPALVLSDAATFNAPAGHAVLVMITAEANAPWPLDCPLLDLAMAGLPAPSKVRFKLFTLDQRLVRGVLGQLAAEDQARVRMCLTSLLGEAPPYRLQEPEPVAG
ncbi:MAG: type II toxin-antitoxin system PemK/MazF family toxin [Pseudomonadota bacterium]|nr:type II toxin-antitoxin system PemK/MazF family toxin [Pseudomonadota bacterium]